MKKFVIHKNSNSGNWCGKRVKKLVTEENFNWKIDEKLIVKKAAWNLEVEKWGKEIINDKEIISWKITRKKF